MMAENTAVPEKYDEETEVANKFGFTCPECAETFGPYDSEKMCEVYRNKHKDSDKCRDTADKRFPNRRPALQQPVVFHSKVRELKVLLQHGKTITSPRGGQIVDPHNPDLYAEFRDWQMETTNPEIIDLMRNHPSNVAVREAMGQHPLLDDSRFYEEGHEVGEAVAARQGMGSPLAASA